MPRLWSHIHGRGAYDLGGCSKHLRSARPYIGTVVGSLRHLLNAYLESPGRNGDMFRCKDAYCASTQPQFDFATRYSPTIEPTGLGLGMWVGGVAYAQFVRSLDTSRVSDKPLIGRLSMGSSIHHRPATRGRNCPTINDSVSINVAGLEDPATVPLKGYLKT